MSEQPDEPERVPMFNAVFVISLVLVAGIGAWGAVDSEGMTGAVQGFTSFLLTGISWYWLAITTAFVLISIFMAFGPYKDVRLGRDDERPEFGTGSWIAMLFAGGMGAGLLFWGVAEPIYHFNDPPGMEGGTTAAAREALVITNLHWGLHAWSIYGVCALVIAYFTFRRGQSSEISTPILSLFARARCAGRWPPWPTCWACSRWCSGWRARSPWARCRSAAAWARCSASRTPPTWPSSSWGCCSSAT